MNGPDDDPEAGDAFIDAVPDDPYSPCPCGCGQKWRFVRGDPDAHYRRFVDDWHAAQPFRGH